MMNAVEHVGELKAANYDLLVELRHYGPLISETPRYREEYNEYRKLANY